MLALGPGLGMASAMVYWYYDFVAKLGYLGYFCSLF